MSAETRGPHLGPAQGHRGDAVRGATPVPARSWLSRTGHRLTLRLTLQVAILGLLLCTVLAIGIVNFLSARHTTRLLETWYSLSPREQLRAGYVTISIQPSER